MSDEDKDMRRLDDFIHYDLDALKIQHAEVIEGLLWAHAIFSPDCLPVTPPSPGILHHLILLGDGRTCRILTDLETGQTTVSSWYR